MMQSGYEPHAASYILNWLKDEKASIMSIKEKLHECGAILLRLKSDYLFCFHELGV